MLRISQIRLRPGEPVRGLRGRIARMLKENESEIQNVKIVKESIDARNKMDLRFVYTADFDVKNPERILRKARKLHANVTPAPDNAYAAPLSGYEGTDRYDGPRPVVIGTGPCGMFAGLVLAEAGLKPLILERGKPVEERSRDVEHFWETGELDAGSNVQFGEGGAGTFSDGKLTTGISDPRIAKVNEEFVEAGASDTILYRHMPHIGTDVLREVVKRIRQKTESLGGTICFGRKVTGLRTGQGRLMGLELEDGSVLDCSCAVLAAGNSARDTFEMLYASGIGMIAKPFSAGVRIEHPQELINYAQYGEVNDSEGRLSAATYKLSFHCRDSGRGVYTFCMCPGGYVIAAASEAGGEVTNGMSRFARDGANANSALLVSVSPEDCVRETGEDHPLAGMIFQRQLERAAFELGGGSYYAPAETVGHFLGHPDTAPSVEPTYRPGVRWASVRDCLPSFITDSMEEALPQMARRLRGFDLDGAVMTAVETRSSSPVRILRDEDMQSVSLRGLYPCGEGAGYAGGIMSSAVDGIKAAEKIIEKLAEQK